MSQKEHLMKRPVRLLVAVAMSAAAPAALLTAPLAPALAQADDLDQAASALRAIGTMKYRFCGAFSISVRICCQASAVR